MLYSEVLRADGRFAHGFSTGVGPQGVSLDLGPGCPEAHWRWVARECGLPDAGIAICSQVHRAGVLEVQVPGLAGEADALVTRQAGLLLAIRTADCAAILVAAPGGVAAIHAGWRGVAAGVVPAALRALAPQEAPLAVIGPAICGRCYEVGEEVVDGIAATGPPRELFVRRDLGPRPHVDIRAAVRWQLEAAGCRVAQLPACTFEDPQLHSYRRVGPGGGRLAALIGLQC